MKFNFILMVADQNRSTELYKNILGFKPDLNVPGMTEFSLQENFILGLIPEKGIKRILGEKIQDPEKSNGVSRCEVYLTVASPQDYINRAIESGAKLISPLSKRNWGDTVGYVVDYDGHIIAFAKKS